MNNAPAKRVQCKGTGTMIPPPMTVEELDAIKARADAIEDQQTRTDLFRLLKVARRMLVMETTNGG